jgi:hypothetical protein
MPSIFVNKCHSFNATYHFHPNGKITSLRDIQKMEKEGEPASMRMVRWIL